MEDSNPIIFLCIMALFLPYISLKASPIKNCQIDYRPNNCSRFEKLP